MGRGKSSAKKKAKKNKEKNLANLEKIKEIGLSKQEVKEKVNPGEMNTINWNKRLKKRGPLPNFI